MKTYVLITQTNQLTYPNNLPTWLTYFTNQTPSPMHCHAYNLTDFITHEPTNNKPN